MILFLDENNTLQLTDKAMMIKSFRVIYDKFPDKDLAMAHFSLIYYMYHFQSQFLREVEDEKERIRSIKQYIHRGDEVKIDRSMRKAMNQAEQIYISDSTYMYLTMRRNIDKLQDYAERMTMVAPDPDDVADIEPNCMPVIVDYKEFTTINSLLPKQQDELDKFETKLAEQIRSNIDVYGGGSLGAYEE